MGFVFFAMWHVYFARTAGMPPGLSLVGSSSTGKLPLPYVYSNVRQGVPAPQEYYEEDVCQATTLVGEFLLSSLFLYVVPTYLVWRVHSGVFVVDVGYGVPFCLVFLTYDGGT